MGENYPRDLNGRCPSFAQGALRVEQFIQEWSYLGVFLGIVATGLGFPMPEELPVVLGGVLVGYGHASWLMLPVCIVGVVVGDSALYGVGRLGGDWLVAKPFVKKHLLSPERLEHIRENFNTHGVKILLFARLTPGIRAPIFLTAGITRLPLYQFIFADALYAIPGVSLLFVLGWYFTDTMVEWIRTEAGHIKSIVILVAILAVAGYFLYRFLRRPMVEGNPQDVPQIVQPVQHTLEQLSKIVNPPPKDASSKDASVKVEQK
jgi:membrane protein DedA with SNARE-associated domain